MAEATDAAPVEIGPAGVPGESALLGRLRAGEEAAFEELVRMHGGRLLAVARRVTRSEADAEDAVQEAFLSAFKALEGFDGRSSLGTWLHRIVVNAALAQGRRRHSRREVAIEDLLPRFRDGLHAEPPARQPNSGLGVTRDDASGIQEKAVVWDALDQLPEEFRTVIVLRDVQGLESGAVAVSLGISDALVRQRLHRARQALAKLLQPAMHAASVDKGDKR